MKTTRSQLRKIIESEITLRSRRKKAINESFSLSSARVLKQNRKVIGFDAKPYVSSIRKLVKLIKNKQNEDIEWDKEIPLMLIESGLISDATDAMLKLATISLFGVLPGGKLVKDVLLGGISGKVKDFIESKINHSLVMRYLESANPTLYSIFKKEVNPSFNRDGSLNISENILTRRQLRKLIFEHVDDPSAAGDPKYIELPDHAASTLQAFGGLDSVLENSEATTQFIELVLSVDEGRAQSLQYFLRLHASAVSSARQAISLAQKQWDEAHSEWWRYRNGQFHEELSEAERKAEAKLRSIKLKHGERISNLRRIIIALRSQGKR